MTSAARQICRQLEELKKRDRPLDEILTLAVELVHNASPLYHWTGIYELFPDQVLRLGPFIGAPTNHVFICVGQGVCGSAVEQKKNMNIPDVSKALNYLACSDETRSELVVLIRKGDRQILLVGDSIASAKVPVPGDEITIQGSTYVIVADGVTSDPALAQYTCHCRSV